jgi:hypothetical protein
MFAIMTLYKVALHGAVEAIEVMCQGAYVVRKQRVFSALAPTSLDRASLSLLRPAAVDYRGVFEVLWVM